MHFPFQTLAVGAVVTVIHFVVIAAMKPATLEVSKYFQALEMDAFVGEVLVKHDAGGPELESDSTMIVGIGDILGEADSEPVQEAAPIAGPEQPVETAETFMDLEKEMDSVKAVANVRIFAGRVSKPELGDYTSEPIVAEPVAAEPVKIVPATVVRPKQGVKKTGPFELREIRPVSRQ